MRLGFSGPNVLRVESLRWRVLEAISLALGHVAEGTHSKGPGPLSAFALWRRGHLARLAAVEIDNATARRGGA